MNLLRKGGQCGCGNNDDDDGGGEEEQANQEYSNLSCVKTQTLLNIFSCTTLTYKQSSLSCRGRFSKYLCTVPLFNIKGHYIDILFSCSPKT